MIVDDPAIARFVATNGVDTLFVDLERHGKQERQGHLPSWKSGQGAEDISKIRNAAPDADLLVRINPWHEGSAEEIADAIGRGADKIMLPMFRTIGELESFFKAVGDKAQPVPLFETAASLEIAREACGRLPMSLVHIGMNDLHLDLGNRFMFEPLADGVLEEPCAAFRAAGIEFGVGGLARVREGIVGPEFLLGEHARLGSTGAILSRTFHRNAETLEELVASTDFAAEVALLRATFHDFSMADAAALERNRLQTSDHIRDVARLVRQA
jgi:hypothetical protein